MSFTGVDSLDRSIDKTNVWLADIAQGFGTGDRRLAYRPFPGVNGRRFLRERSNAGPPTSALKLVY